MKIILTALILLIAACCIWFVWSKNIDYVEWLKSKMPDVPLKNVEPNISYGIISLPTNYATGLRIDDIEWRENYSQHNLTIVNTSKQNVKNIIISISLPAGIVKSKIESSVNVFNINLSSFNQPMTLGSYKIENTFSNHQDISIEKLNKHSRLTISQILEYRNKPKEWWNNARGFWQFDISYEYEKSKGKWERHRIINPIKILNEKPLVIQVDKEENYVNQENLKVTHDTYPFSPIISKADGRFVPVENFSGSLESIILKNGEALLNSMGFDYTVNTDNEYQNK